MSEPPPGHRGHPILAIALVAAIVSLAAILVLSALFSDWSGEHRVNPVPLAAAAAVLVGGLRLARRIARGSGSEGS